MAENSDEVDQLLRAIMPQAPEVMHHVFALEGANEVLLGLNTVESKMAYLIQIIAIELYKASKAISSKNISFGPNDLRFHILQSDDLFVSYPYNITLLDLGELEDLYYATCAKLKELIQGVDTLLTNGFKEIHDTYFAYCNDPLSSRYKPSPGGSLTQHIVERGHREVTEEYTNIPEKYSEHNSECRMEVEGLQNKSKMSCGMIFGELAEKYRPMILNAGLEGLMIDRKSTPEAPQTFQQEVSTRKYISPYNLDERAKKLNVPGGPEMPCICDPECICAPLCASDPTQNCLCEENGLFVRVTEGMDIDDLDVPDLVRREKRLSEASEISTASLNTTTGSFSQRPLDSASYIEGEQYTEASDNVAVPDPMSATASHPDHGLPMSGRLMLLQRNDDLSWQDRLSMPPLRLSDFTHYELMQPFAKQCDHPPKRQSVAERFFKTKSSRMAAQKKDSSMDQPTQGHNLNSSTNKVAKQAKKRSLADISFIGLRLNLGRGSHGH